MHLEDLYFLSPFTLCGQIYFMYKLRKFQLPRLISFAYAIIYSTPLKV